MSVRRLFIGVLAMVVLLTVGTAASASAAPRHLSGGYLALGDSVAFGYTPPETTPPLAYFNPHNFVGYPEDFAAATGLHLTNASCPGETTISMIKVGGQSNGCENSVGSPVGYRTVYPLHVFYLGTQLDYALFSLWLHPRTSLITIDIGANDMFVCQQVNADQCTGSDFQAALTQVTRNVTAIFSALRYRAHYRGSLVLVSYYSLDYRDPTQNAESLALNAALAGPLHRFGGVITDGYGAFARAAQPYGGNTCAAGLLVVLPDGTCNVHPSPKGHQVLAAAIAHALGV